MQINILIGGKAGDGTITVSEVVSSSLVKAGFFVFNYKDYQSLIRGGHNFNIVSFSDQPINSNENNIDILIAFDNLSYEVHKKNITKDTVVATADEELSKILDCLFVDTRKLGKTGNMAFASFIFKVLGLKKELLIDEIKTLFSKKEIVTQNEQVIDQYYSNEYKQSNKLTIPTLPKKSNNTDYCYIGGSEAIADAAIDAGLEIYFGYPMTPSTALLISLSLKQKKLNTGNKKGLFVFTPENEVAIVNSALGASYAGKRVMIGTSGGGFDLMTEGISMQGMAEIPLIIHLAQRMGPGTGVPTYTSQADLNVAIYSGHGEFPRLVVAPGDAEEAYEKTIEAIYLAEKFNLLSIILTDKHLAESSYTAQIKKSKLKIPLRKNFPGKGIFRQSSYEHNLSGDTIEDPKSIKEGVERRLLKSEKLVQEIHQFTRYKVKGNGKNLIVGYGSTKGAIQDTLFRENTGLDSNDFTHLHLIYMEPFPMDKEIFELFKKAKNIFVVENTSTGQLSELICRHLAIKIPGKSRILKYDSLPFTPKYLENEINSRLKNKTI
ncbi:MAG: 2-oxoacid:acceptor oxidoreductase family protein [Candidatus Woesearchaeota archaeon]